MARKIVCADMDYFFAAVEIRDNPDLAGKPLIIGALPHERGVVSTCSYEARRYGVRSAMSIKDAYRLCPDGIYMHPNFHKYEEASSRVQSIWSEYSDTYEFIALDEGFIDVTNTENLFGGAEKIGWEIKERVKNLTALTCSVGIGYSIMSAKLASEEKKPDGFYQILTPEALVGLIIDRSVRVVYGVGSKTADELKKIGVHTVRDIYNNRQAVVNLLGNHGRLIVELADGIDERCVARQAKSHSYGKERTFQRDILDYNYLKDVLLMIAKELSFNMRLKGTFCQTVTLKITYRDMKKITRSKSGDSTNKADEIYKTAAELLDNIEKRPVRLVGITLSGITDSAVQQLSLFNVDTNERVEKLDATVLKLQREYGSGIIKTGAELSAEKRLKSDKAEVDIENANLRY